MRRLHGRFIFVYFREVRQLAILGWITVGLFFGLLFVIAWIDAKTMRIPNRLNACMLVLGICAIVTVPGPAVIQRLLGMLVISGCMILVVLILPGGFGGGDIKLMAAGGLFLGLEGSILAVELSILAGGFYAIFLVIWKKAKRKDFFPFGPFLCGGMMASFVILCMRGSYHII